MNKDTLNQIPKDTLITLCKELISKIENHNYDNPDVFALYGYCTLLLQFASKLNFGNENKFLFVNFIHHYNKELDIAVSSVGADREEQYKFLSLLASSLFSFKEELEKL